MNLNIEIKPDFNGSIQIIDISDESTSQVYIDDDSELNYSVTSGDSSFKYSDCYTIDVLKRIKSDAVTTVETKYTSHTSSDSVTFKLPEDGYYSVDHLVIPTTDWLATIKASLDSEVLTDLQTVFKNGLYVTDGVQVYKVTIDDDLSTEVVDLEEVVEINPLYTSISIATYKVFSIDNLKKCYLNIASKILCAGVRCGKIDSDLRFKRDFIWMTINVINFYLESDLYTEAEIVLEDLGCYNFCDDGNNTTPNKRPCGCHH